MLGLLHVLRTQGAKASACWSAAHLRDRLLPPTYPRWIARYDTPTPGTRPQMQDEIATWTAPPLISVLMPVASDIGSSQVAKGVLSLRRQAYPNWELCIAADEATRDDIEREMSRQAGSENRLRFAVSDEVGSMSNKSNRALALASGEYIALMAGNAELSEHALYWVARELRAHPDADLIFSDEDKIGDKGERHDPWFKPDWNPALMLSQNAFGNLGVYRHSLVEGIGGFRSSFDGDQDYDLVLRCADETSPEKIRHIPRILYHARDDLALDAADMTDRGRRAIEQQVARTNISARVERARRHSYQVDYALPRIAPRVSILIATTGNPRLLEPCLLSIFKLTSYQEFEILLLANERNRDALLNWRQARVRLCLYPDAPFSHSAVNNWGANQASGDLLCFLNDDTEVITPNWLERLAARATLPGVAAAGPMLYYPNDTVQHAGVILGLGGVAGHACHGIPRGTCGPYDRACLEQDVSCLTAACLMMRKTTFEDAGKFDEKLPLTFNDVDLCLRVRAAGWRMIWTPTVELYHRESFSIGQYHGSTRRDEILRAAALMRKRWAAVLDNDPCYNPNLSLRTAYQLAFPPRRIANLDQKRFYRPPVAEVVA